MLVWYHTGQGAPDWILGDVFIIRIIYVAILAGYATCMDACYEYELRHPMHLSGVPKILIKGGLKWSREKFFQGATPTSVSRPL